MAYPISFATVGFVFPGEKTCGHFRDVLWPSFVQCPGVAAVGQSKASIRPSDPLA